MKTSSSGGQVTRSLLVLQGRLTSDWCCNPDQKASHCGGSARLLLRTLASYFLPSVLLLLFHLSWTEKGLTSIDSAADRGTRHEQFTTERDRIVLHDPSIFLFVPFIWQRTSHLILLHRPWQPVSRVRFLFSAPPGGRPATAVSSCFFSFSSAFLMSVVHGRL